MAATILLKQLVTMITRCLSSKHPRQLCNTVAMYWQGKDNRLLPANYSRISTSGILVQTRCCICMRCERCSRDLCSQMLDLDKVTNCYFFPYF